MAVVSSGTITMTNIVTEFGGTAPHALSEYYRGAGLVPDIAANNNVPTSGTINFSDFYGAIAALYVTEVSSGVQSGKSGSSVGYFLGSFGDATDTTVDFLGDATLKQLYQANTFGVTATVYFQVSGTHSNSGFDTATFETSVSGGGTTTRVLNRTDATFNQYGSSSTEWAWVAVSGAADTFTAAFKTNISFA